MQVQVIRPFYWAGELKQFGNILELPTAQARELIASNKAAAALNAVLEPPAEQKPEPSEPKETAPSHHAVRHKG